MDDLFDRIVFELDNTILFTHKLIEYINAVQTMRMCDSNMCYVSHIMRDTLNNIVENAKQTFEIKDSVLTSSQSISIGEPEIIDMSLVGKGIIVDRDVSKLDDFNYQFMRNIVNGYVPRYITTELVLSIDGLKYHIHSNVERMISRVVNSMTAEQLDIIMPKLKMLER